MSNLNPGQQKLVDDANSWFKHSSEQVFQFTGGPGTGKTWTLIKILNRLGIPMEKVAPMAYTGAAAIVMRMKGLWGARTAHSTLYQPVLTEITDERGNVVYDTYFNKPKMRLTFVPRDLGDIDLIVIDEGWMIPRSMKKEIESRGIKIIVAGDPDQLPPVADDPAYFCEGNIRRLDQIMRQAEGSAIIYLCQRAKQGLPIHTGMYGNDVLVITESELTNVMLSFSNVVLCGKNATRDKMNSHIRQNIIHKHSPTPEYGEKLICRKNNWGIEVEGINLTNGLTGTVINQPDPSSFNGKSFTIDFMPDLINSPFLQLPVDYKYFTASFQEKKAIKNMPNYDGSNHFEFGYAQTVHLAQGSQWPQGIYFEEYLHRDINNQLNYTALSRFSKFCIYVKPDRKYY